ncbi:hypothetical protein [Nocardia wallacei]|uniref:hypothetical protein n=1 Tax=Nocardia wallacei TaxID=480035 RepID=UPI002458EB99|nr:hypothetical protein [Nocardia wallacei]
MTIERDFPGIVDLVAAQMVFLVEQAGNVCDSLAHLANIVDEVLVPLQTSGQARQIGFAYDAPRLVVTPAFALAIECVFQFGQVLL